MNLGRVKTFLIILFLGINIFLVASHISSTRFAIDDKTIEDTISIIKEYGITIDKDTVFRYTVNLRNVDANNVLYSDAFKKKNKDHRFSFDENSFAASFKAKGILKKNDREIKNHVISRLEDYGFSTDHMEFGSMRKTSEGKSFNIYCKIKKYQIFDNRITVNIDDNSFDVKGMWYEPTTNDISMNSHSRKTVYITSVLMDLTDNPDAKKNLPFTITDIDYGYLSGSIYGSGGHVTATALPYYRIKDNKGNVYYYDASNGKYFK